jgi:hypothetical protein
MENWEEGIFEPDTDISLETEQGLFVHLYMKMDDIYFTVGDPLHEGWTEDYQDSESGYVGTYLVRGNEIKKILNKGLAECLFQAMEPEDSCDFMMSELEGFELDIEGGTSWRS